MTDDAGRGHGRGGAAQRGVIARHVSMPRVVHPSFHPELVPVFMMIETELFRRLNEKAALRNIGYDAMVRIILREHVSDYE